MVFTTISFAVFFAITFLAYYLVPQKFQWGILLLANCVFYAWASPLYLIFLFATISATYCGARLIEARKEKKFFLVLTTCLLLGMLLAFKYTNFILKNIEAAAALFGSSLAFPTLNLILPVGLSFYIFQSLGYCVDVYREVIPAEKNFLRHSLYVSFFPQLLQGPIGDYSRLAPQLFSPHDFSYKQSVFGLQRCAWGLFKKLVIANQLSTAINILWIQDGQEYSGFVFWFFALFLYSIQLYSDFSGYMDIAIGCAQALGIQIDENFERPFFSRGVAEYWRRWHITLGVWFKNYVFYPLLRSEALSRLRKRWRKSNPYLSNTVPTAIALMIVWILLGFWHGADWGYVMYSVYHGSFLVLSTFLLPVYSKFHNKFPKLQSAKPFIVFQAARTYLIVIISFVFFAPGNISVTASILQRMKSGFGFSQLMHFIAQNFRSLGAAGLGTVVLLFVDLFHENTQNVSLREIISKKNFAKRWLLYAALLCATFILGAYGAPGLNQFAYFRF